jgi:excinuclease ABC subunit C
MKRDEAVIEKLKNLIKDFPTSPGVYLMKNRRDKIIYVGKAKNLKSRVRSYFTSSDQHSAKTLYLVSNIFHIDYILTQTEVEAFLLEASLIKKHRPRYNIRLKDDKAYPYIRVSTPDDFPRLYLTRKVVQDGSHYFGPYTNSASVRETIKFLNRTFRIRDCRDHFMKGRTRPCMTYQIGRCTAPCVAYVTKEEYAKDVKNVVRFLEGSTDKILRDLEKNMKAKAAEEQFEAAAQLRDSWRALQSILARQVVVSEGSFDQDIFAYCGDERGTLIESLHLRKGRLIGSQSRFFPQIDPNSEDENPKEWLTSFLSQYYLGNFIPDQVVLSVDLGFEIHRLIEDLLRERGKPQVKVVFGAGPLQDLVQMALKNAKAHFENYVSKSEAKKEGLEEIQRKLGLKEFPYRIECFDISHFQGAETVASQVVFEDGVPNKEFYRRYKLRTVATGDDYAAMKEVLSRRFSKNEQEDPQLLVVDGGKGQLRMATEIFAELGKANIPVVGLAKARTSSGFAEGEVMATEERFYLPGRQNPVVFKPNSEAFRILVSLRDEAHRFAVSYHRLLREKGLLESVLYEVEGLGETRVKKLLKNFDGLQGILAAKPDEISKLGGISLALAKKVQDYLSTEYQIKEQEDLEGESQTTEKT